MARSDRDHEFMDDLHEIFEASEDSCNERICRTERDHEFIDDLNDILEKSGKA